MYSTFGEAGHDMEELIVVYGHIKKLFKQPGGIPMANILWVPFSGPLENVEIYFSKIDIKIFAIDTIFLLHNRVILTK